ncbi:zeta toxin family protein, partial [Escherichia coli]
MKKELETILPEFGEAIRPYVYSYVTANKNANAKHVLFMAGSPAAGKTELLNRLLEQHGITNIVRIDADDFRWWFPYYNEEN